jgi:hypothetical protein
MPDNVPLITLLSRLRRLNGACAGTLRDLLESAY